MSSETLESLGVEEIEQRIYDWLSSQNYHDAVAVVSGEPTMAGPVGFDVRIYENGTRYFYEIYYPDDSIELVLYDLETEL